ncbi:patatin-like phospholipase family protein [Aestuariimicrobium kwangyangense]|uniref:patatin-like phospholipase family protein n=1 Tax=Aestuariimicrobium kwangyangense TaxID=396389 RepID=UPI0003B76CF3|nr:patatin-like phospholipase family protein [Aestuariimicrobium kwangyangense]
MTQQPVPTDLSDPAAYSAPDRECDIIMKGGITSGVVYPLAACRLATRHRLRQLGGSSAGAIAAALAAAAEHGRSTAPSQLTSTDAGFPRLAQLPDFLGGHLLGLFQPMPSTRAAFELVLGALAQPTTSGKVQHSVKAAIAANRRWFWVPVLATLVAAVLLVLASSGVLTGERGGVWSWLSPLLLALVVLAVVVLVGIGLAVWRMVRDTARVMNRSGFGLVNGHDPSGQTLPLTDWMTRTINQTAGLPADGRPLTLGDLWGPEAVEVHRSLRDKPNASPAEWSAFDPRVTLTTTTTCLDQGRPYQLPFTSDIFHFCPDCLAEYFPVSVTKHLRATARPASQVPQGPGPIPMECPRHPGTQVLKLPDSPDLPVVMLARLSLSFPVLICAVPLHYIDFARAEGKRSLVVGWFSDGGIANNFPMQFFDRLMPRRPTFGINLANEHPDFPDSDVYQMPQTGQRLVRSLPITSVIGLFAGMKRTWQDWSDQLQTEVPGFRDRIVEVAMHQGEGGLNLAMPAEIIAALSSRGDEAGRRLLEFDLEAHRWIRFRTAMSSLSEVLEQLQQPHDPLPDPWQGSYKFSSHRQETLTREEFDQLVALARAWRADNYPATGEGNPRPVPRLRHVLRT